MLVQTCVAECVEMVVMTFASLARIFFFFFGGGGKNVRQFILRLRFFFFFLKWRLARVHLFHSLGQDQSTVVWLSELRRLWQCVP